MSKKKKSSLLNESTVQRWAVLSGGKKLNEERIQELGIYEMPEDEEELGDEVPAEEPSMEDELDAEPEMSAGGGEEEIVQDIVSAVAAAIEDVTGVPVDVEGGADDMADEMPAVSGDEEEMPPMEDEEEMPPMEDEEELDEDGRGRSGDEVAGDRKPKGTGRRPAGLNALEESEDTNEVEDALEEDAGADWKGEDHKLSKAKEVKPKAMYEVDSEMVAEIARRVAVRLLEDKKKKGQPNKTRSIPKKK